MKHLAAKTEKEIFFPSADPPVPRWRFSQTTAKPTQHIGKGAADAFRSLRELWVRMSNTGSTCQAPPSNMRASFKPPLHPTPCFPPQCRRGYLQFLVDSKVVYEALEEACGSDPRLAEFRNTGLERTEALTKVRLRTKSGLGIPLVVRFWVP